MNPPNPSAAETSRPAFLEDLQVSVVIPVRNNPTQLHTLLQSLSRSRGPAFEVIVVNDASTDSTRDVAVAGGAVLVDLPEQRGPASARNAGALVARGRFIVFLDADVSVQEGTIARLASTLESRPDLAAVFGSYDAEPTAGNMISQYRNLFHHFVHQTSSELASTFWAGCGAVRRSVFVELCGFDERYTRPCVEDIELGMRMNKAGYRILLDRGTQVTHLKRWDLWSMLVTDIFDRGVPWTRLILREWSLPNDLNLRSSQRISAVIAAMLLGVFAVMAWREPLVLLFPALSLVMLLALDSWSLSRRIPNVVRVLGVILAAASVYLGIRIAPVLTSFMLLMLLMLATINATTYSFFARARHPLFTMVVLPLHILFLWYGILSLCIGTVTHACDGSGQIAKARRRPESLTKDLSSTNVQ